MLPNLTIGLMKTMFRKRQHELRIRFPQDRVLGRRVPPTCGSVCWFICSFVWPIFFSLVRSSAVCYLVGLFCSVLFVIVVFRLVFSRFVSFCWFVRLIVYLMTMTIAMAMRMMTTFPPESTFEFDSNCEALVGLAVRIEFKCFLPACFSFCFCFVFDKFCFVTTFSFRFVFVSLPFCFFWNDDHDDNDDNDDGDVAVVKAAFRELILI